MQTLDNWVIQLQVDEEECLNKVILDDTESLPQSTVSSQLGNSASDKNTQDLAQSEENSWYSSSNGIEIWKL